MKLSNETLTVLKNFSSINQGIQFKKGSKLTTVSSGKTVLAQANLKDVFPQDFCIYDLNQFLSVNSLFKDSAELEFNSSALSPTFNSDNRIHKSPAKTVKKNRINYNLNQQSPHMNNCMHFVMRPDKIARSIVMPL